MSTATTAEAELNSEDVVGSATVFPEFGVDIVLHHKHGKEGSLVCRQLWNFIVIRVNVDRYLHPNAHP